MRLSESRQLIAKSFEQAVSSYDKVADLQYMIGNDLINQLAVFVQQPDIVLDVGAGTGRLSALLTALAPDAEYLLLDLAYALIASYRHSARTSVHALCADFDYLPLQSGSVDLLFSNMSLQWSLNLSQTLIELLRCVKSGGLLAMAFPVEGTLSELAKTHRINRFLSVVQVNEILASLAVSVLFSEKKVYQKNYDNPLSLLRFLKSTGANCCLSQHSLPLKRYNFRDQANIQSDFHIYFLILEKR